MTTERDPGALSSTARLDPLPAPEKVWMTQGLGAMHAYSERQMLAYAAKLVDAEREPQNVVFRALLLAAWEAPGTRTAGEMRDAAVTLFGAAAVDAALAKLRA